MIAWPRLASFAAAVVLAATASAQAQNDGLRTVEVRKFGIVVRAPLAWPLIRWAQDDKAFVLRLPQEEGSAPGFVSCELAIAPESLADYQKRQASNNVDVATPGKPARKLLSNEIETARPAGDDVPAEDTAEHLLSVWEVTDERGRTTFEVCRREIHYDVLYSLRLVTDEAHFSAYRLDFDDMVASAKFNQPETGVQKLPGGFWMQREYRFAMRLPAEWKPTFGPNDRALFFATGKTREVFTDNLLVLAEPARPMDLAALSKELPATVQKLDPLAKVQSKIVPQNGAGALEIVIETKRGAFDVTVLERRFQSRRRNYEVKFTCQSDEFEKIEGELRKALDSFIEVADKLPENPL